MCFNIVVTINSDVLNASQEASFPKHLTCIVVFNSITPEWNRCYYYLHFTSERHLRLRADKQLICPKGIAAIWTQVPWLQSFCSFHYSRPPLTNLPSCTLSQTSESSLSPMDYFDHLSSALMTHSSLGMGTQSLYQLVPESTELTRIRTSLCLGRAHKLRL